MLRDCLCTAPGVQWLLDHGTAYGGDFNSEEAFNLTRLHCYPEVMLAVQGTIHMHARMHTHTHTHTHTHAHKYIIHAQKLTQFNMHTPHNNDAGHNLFFSENGFKTAPSYSYDICSMVCVCVCGCWGGGGGGTRINIIIFKILLC